MGATTFYSEAEGKTAQEAFDRARQEAGWESGHGGYSGTIVEKHGFVPYDLPAGMTASDLFTLLSNVSYEVLDGKEPEPLYQTATYTRTVTMKVTETRTVRVPVGEKPPAEPTIPSRGSYDTSHAVITRALKWKKPTITPPHEWEIKAYEQRKQLPNIPNLRRMCENFDDKWGSAVAVPAGPNRWAFMGYASC